MYSTIGIRPYVRTPSAYSLLSCMIFDNNNTLYPYYDHLIQGEKIDKTVGTRDDVEIRTLSKSNLVISKVI